MNNCRGESLWVFTRRLPAGGPDDYVLEFRNLDKVKYAAWTRSETPRTVTLDGRAIQLTDEPRYLAGL